MANTLKQAIVAYVPVIHAGYLRLFHEHADVKTLFLVDRWLFVSEFPSLEKDIRALSVEDIRKSLGVLGIPQTDIELINNENDWGQLKTYRELAVPDDEIMRWLVDKYLIGTGIKVTYDRSHFLRWDKPRSLAKRHVEPDVEITTEELHRSLMGVAVQESQHSADWWRQVGGVVARDGKALLTGYNKHVPYEQQQYIVGDPRALFSSGVNIDLTSSIHTEQALIGTAAARGIRLKGTDLYSTTFPCPFCAKLIAYSGIKRVFFKEGYSMLDGEELLKEMGVEIIKVERDETQKN